MLTIYLFIKEHHGFYFLSVYSYIERLWNKSVPVLTYAIAVINSLSLTSLYKPVHHHHHHHLPHSPVGDDLLGGQAIRHGDTASLDVRPPLSGRWMWPRSPARQGERGLQVPEGHCAVDGAQQLSAGARAHGPAGASVVPDQSGQRVEGLVLQEELHLRLSALHQNLTDAAVHHILLPAARDHVITRVGQRVSHQEIPAAQNQRLRHLQRSFKCYTLHVQKLGDLYSCKNNDFNQTTESFLLQVADLNGCAIIFIY